jgi:hypothetical protein
MLEILLQDQIVSMVELLLVNSIFMMFIISGSILQVTFVMAYLNGNDIPDFFRPSTLFTKVIHPHCPG